MAYPLGWTWCLRRGVVSAVYVVSGCHCWTPFNLRWSGTGFFFWLCDIQKCQQGFYIWSSPVHICELSWAQTLRFQMWTLQTNIPSGNPNKQLPLLAVGMNFVHCYSSYSGSRFISSEQEYILQLFRRSAPPGSKVSCILPWLRSEPTLLLCEFKRKESFISLVFCTHQGMENTERRLCRLGDCFKPTSHHQQPLSSFFA